MIFKLVCVNGMSRKLIMCGWFRSCDTILGVDQCGSTFDVHLGTWALISKLQRAGRASSAVMTCRETKPQLHGHTDLGVSFSCSNQNKSGGLRIDSSNDA